ncbi:type II toxin-antitoxin system VapC family toxin [Thiocapsa rosea]|uniref:PIN domain nuclease of toxin-antitoxin system n=1 Tax=Thiocapsa rosea TaxID=69360 RepID=A0A495VG79_9GAMM|nr:type II toxin-antitoxin system VapC family toxin [Thiocapsa rosea]RKT46838.1 PIN domain nuclease of toxin-antitoxin system [Thiocapsa rosea]
MNLLLDTHVALWAIVDSPRLSTMARDLILNPRARVWISVASIWEIAIQYRLGRGNMPISGSDAIGFFRTAGYQFLPVEPEHAAATETLPPHHQDPFDRILAAQAQVEPMRLLTHDPLLVPYGDFIVAV